MFLSKKMQILEGFITKKMQILNLRSIHFANLAKRNKFAGNISNGYKSENKHFI